MKNNRFVFGSQDLLKLNLTESQFDWWTWNGITKSSTTKGQRWLFRIGEVDGDPGNIQSVTPYFPYRLGEGGTTIVQGGTSNVTLRYYSDSNAITTRNLSTINFMNNDQFEDPDLGYSDTSMYAVEFDGREMQVALLGGVAFNANRLYTYQYSGYVCTASIARVVLSRSGVSVTVYGTMVFVGAGTSFTSNVAGTFRGIQLA